MHAHTRDNEESSAILFKDVLDALSIAIFVIEPGNRVVFSNKSADALLTDGCHVRAISGSVNGHRTLDVPKALGDAIDRVTGGIAITGIAVPLFGANGKQSAGYVLPIAGQDLNSGPKKKFCAVFIAQQGGQQPMVIEILRTMFDLTSSEARIAALIAKGDGPQTIAETLGVTINTVRSHLKHAFSKTRANDQTALGALVNGLIAPITCKV